MKTDIELQRDAAMVEGALLGTIHAVLYDGSIRIANPYLIRSRCGRDLPVEYMCFHNGRLRSVTCPECAGTKPIGKP